MSDLNSDFNLQRYSNLNSWKKARYQGYVQNFETRLAAVQAQIADLMNSPVESYNLNAGDGGSQQATYRKLTDLQKQEEYLIGMIYKYTSLIYGGGIVSHDQRRKG